MIKCDACNAEDLLYRLSPLKTITVLKLSLVNETPIRIGAEGGVEEGSIYVENNVPVIPGSSVKGVLRSFAEKLVAGLCGRVLYPYNMVKSKAFKKCTEDRLNKLSSKGTLLIAALFGSTCNASRVFVSDIKPMGSVSVITRPGIAIDRDLGSVITTGKFSFKYVAPGARWVGEIRIHNLDLVSPNSNCDQSLAELFKQVLNAWSKGLLNFGGRKSTVLGVLRLDPNGSKVESFSVKDGSFVSDFEESLTKILG